MIRVVIVDDHPLMREGVRNLLAQQPDLKVIRDLATGRAALAALAEDEPDVLVLDLSMPDLDGSEVLRRVREAHPAVRVVVLSMYPPAQHAKRSLELGAAAYVSKHAPPAELLLAIRTVARGDRYEQSAADTGARAPHDSLTGREYQIFTLIVQGLPVSDIAAQLDLTSSTVSTHLGHIREKLGVRTVAEIVRYAIDAGLTGAAPGH